MKYLAELLALLQVPQLGAQRIGRLLSEIDFAEFCQYDKTALKQMGWNMRQIQRWQNPERQWIDQALQWATKDNQRILTLFDDDYPFLLKQISTAPPVLFVRGNVAGLSAPQIAIVGSRDCSHYGEHWAGYFTSALVQHQLAVTSGLAIGIDGFCHQRAVAEKGITVAVLGSGLDQVYPARHKKLAEQIVDTNGALVSEFFPGQPPLAENFPRRNRIISGLSLGTLVIEATLNSGSLITARYALEQGREVFALPNALQNHHSQGCHQLIKEGALLVEHVNDILEAIAWQRQSVQVQPNLFEQALPKQAQHSAPKIAKNSPELTACQQQLFARINLEPISIDDLAKAADLAVETVLIELLNLELSGVVKQVSGGYVLGEP